MLSFKELSEKKSKIKINPKQADLKEKQEEVKEAAPLAALAKVGAVAGKVAAGAAKGAAAAGKAGAKAAKAAKPVLKKVGKVAAGAAEAGGNAAKAIGNLPKSEPVEPEEAPSDPEHPELMHKGGKVKKVKEELELDETSPNVTYQAKGGRKSGKLGKSSIYSIRGKDESKKDFRKSHVKDIKDGLLKKEEVETVDEMHVTASMGRHAKAWREKKAEEQRRKDNPAYYAELDKIRAAKAKRAAKKEKNLSSNMKKEEFELEEERAARKMNVRTKGTIKKQIAKDAAAEAKRRANKTGEYKEKPKKKRILKKPSQLTKVTGGSKPEPKKEAPKPKAKAKPKAKPVAAVKKVTPKAKKKEAPRTQKGAMAYDGPNKARSQAADRVKAKTKAKQKSSPKKEAPKKSGVSDRVKDAIKKVVKRHRKATQGARVFGKGFVKGAKDTVKFAGKLKKAVVGESMVTFKQFNEATRLKKEKGYDKGGTKKPSGKKDAALAAVLAKIKKEHGAGAVVGQGSRQKKKVKGAKSDAGTGKYKKAADQKKQTASDAKKRGFKSSQDYVNTMARYGGKDNYDKGRGLGT